MLNIYNIYYKAFVIFDDCFTKGGPFRLFIKKLLYTFDSVIF